MGRGKKELAYLVYALLHAHMRMGEPMPCQHNIWQVYAPCDVHTLQFEPGGCGSAAKVAHCQGEKVCSGRFEYTNVMSMRGIAKKAETLSEDM